MNPHSVGDAVGERELAAQSALTSIGFKGVHGDSWHRSGERDGVVALSRPNVGDLVKRRPDEAPMVSVSSVSWAPVSLAASVLACPTKLEG